MLTGLNHITLSVADVDRAFAFYVDVLGFAPKAKWAQGAYLSLNELWLCLSLDSSARSALSDEYTHIAFSIEPEHIDAMRDRLQQCAVRYWKDNISEGDSLYVLDPDYHKLEIHVGDLDSRLESLKHQPHEALTIYSE